MKTLNLTRGRFALVDDNMFEVLSKFNWSVSSGYAVRGESKNGGRGFKMHRVIIDAKPREEVDHIDGNRLNNQRANLRIASRAQNQMNRLVKQKNNISGFKGVSWCNRTKKWMAQIRIETKTKFLGYFSNRVEAAKAYNTAANLYFGEFSNLNRI